MLSSFGILVNRHIFQPSIPNLPILKAMEYDKWTFDGKIRPLIYDVMNL